MTNTKEIIIKLKEVKEEKGLSLDKIMSMIEENGDFVSKTTLSRVFRDGSEDVKFRYDDTLRPIAKAILDIETIEEDDETDVKAMKAVLKYKAQRIEELERQVERLEAEKADEKNKVRDKLDHQRAELQSKIDILTDQLRCKDRRIDQLFALNEYIVTRFYDKDAQYTELVKRCMG